MSKQVRLSDASKDTIERIKEEHDHTSVDSAFREIAMKAGIEVIPDDKLDSDEDEDEGEDSEGWTSGWSEGFEEER